VAARDARKARLRLNVGDARQEGMTVPFSFFKGKKVFLTGHTGFKGAWLSQILTNAGASLTGYALAPPEGDPSLYNILGLEKRMDSVIGDIRDFGRLFQAYEKASPEIVIHMAAQPLVQEGYLEPRHTYETNVLGTVNILECLRLAPCARSFLNVTTDKVYKNREWAWGYREDDTLGGSDPYSSSKSCSELVTLAFKESFFSQTALAVSTARAGNVIGGGDFAQNRLVPDCVRAASLKTPVILRNPGAMRPNQHVLDALSAYLAVLRLQHGDPSLGGAYTVGPDSCLSSAGIAGLFASCWGEGFSFVSGDEKGSFKETGTLMLDSSLIRKVFGWRWHWDISKAVSMTVEWSKKYLATEDMIAETDRQIRAFMEDGARESG
jgi:CDP-glucose 4,6-dehydratase